MTGSIDSIALFLTEARELSEQLVQGLLQLEQGNSKLDTIHGMFRAAHTIKGSASVVGLDYIMHFTHHVEGVLELVRSEQLALSPALVNLLLRCTDHINALLDCAYDAGLGVDALQGQAEALQQELQQFLQPQGASTMAQPAVEHADAVSFDAASATPVSIGFWPQQLTPDSSAPVSSEAMPLSVPDTAGDSSSASQKCGLTNA